VKTKPNAHTFGGKARKGDKKKGEIWIKKKKVERYREIEVKRLFDACTCLAFTVWCHILQKLILEL
jgi:hypothetical protein